VITYVFDTSLSPKLSTCISCLLPEPDGDDESEDSEKESAWIDHSVSHMCETDEFREHEGHDVWIQRAATRNWIIVTCLSKSRRRLVGELLATHGLRAVHLADGFSKLPRFDQAAKLIAWWAKIVDASYRLKTGAAIVVSVNGAVSDL
jgi:hypothetical protein